MEYDTNMGVEAPRVSVVWLERDGWNDRTILTAETSWEVACDPASSQRVLQITHSTVSVTH